MNHKSASLDVIDHRSLRVSRQVVTLSGGLLFATDEVHFHSVEAAEQWIPPGGFIMVQKGKSVLLWDSSKRRFVLLLDHLAIAPVAARRYAVCMDEISDEQLHLLANDPDPKVKLSASEKMARRGVQR